MPFSLEVPIFSDGFARLVIRVYGMQGRFFDLLAIVDTGATYVVVPSSVCERLGLEVFSPEEPTVSIVTGCGRIDVPRLRAERVELPNTPISKENVVILSKDMPGGISVLGMKLLEDLEITFDLKKMKFLLKDP